MSHHAVLPRTQCAHAATATGQAGVELQVESVLASPAVRGLRVILQRRDQTIDPAPILWKHLPGPTLRLMFPVTGGAVEDGAIVAVVCLYDIAAARTLYAHPMFAGPEVNPLLKHLDGPMATPKAQPGADGDRATLRIMEHKRALWGRFGRECIQLGPAEAGRRWREGYYWSLKRLYFCSRCPPCRWGSPFFDGPVPGMAQRPVLRTTWEPPRPLLDLQAAVVKGILESDAWSVETAYAARGSFRISEHPRLLKELPGGDVQVIFPSDAAEIQAGTLVGVAVTYRCTTSEVVFAHCLCAGPEPEIQFLRGGAALSLPAPQPGKNGEPARSAYATWRREAWSRFWLDELEGGLAAASARWLSEFWLALEALFGGNDLCGEELREHSDNRLSAELR